MTSPGDKMVIKCRACDGNHFTSKCPRKDTILVGVKPTPGGGPSSAGDASKSTMNEYVPPSMREGATKRSDNPNMPRREDMASIRICNLSESTTEENLDELLRPFGPVQRLYLAKDRATGACKGFAFVLFRFRGDAANAIQKLNGYQYDHLILMVDWSKAPTHSAQ